MVRRLVFGALILSGVIACTASSIRLLAPTPPQTIVLEVAGDTPTADVTWRVGTRTVHVGEVTLPWRPAELEVAGTADVALVAQATGGGQVTCRVTVDGEGVPVTASGMYAVAFCRE